MCSLFNMLTNTQLPNSHNIKLARKISFWQNLCWEQCCYWAYIISFLLIKASDDQKLTMCRMTVIWLLVTRGTRGYITEKLNWYADLLTDSLRSWRDSWVSDFGQQSCHFILSQAKLPAANLRVGIQLDSSPIRPQKNSFSYYFNRYFHLTWATCYVTRFWWYSGGQINGVPHYLFSSK